MWGQLGIGNQKPSNKFVPIIGLPPDVVAMQAGGSSSAAICESGQVFVWGRNDWGMLGLGSTTSMWAPTLIKGLVAVHPGTQVFGHSVFSTAGLLSIPVLGMLPTELLSESKGQMTATAAVASTLPHTVIALSAIDSLKTTYSGSHSGCPWTVCTADKTLRKSKRTAPRMRPVARPPPAPSTQKQAALPSKEPGVKVTPCKATS